jgi:hypothetical protein
MAHMHGYALIVMVMQPKSMHCLSENLLKGLAECEEKVNYGSLVPHDSPFLIVPVRAGRDRYVGFGFEHGMLPVCSIGGALGLDIKLAFLEPSVFEGLQISAFAIER